MALRCLVCLHALIIHLQRAGFHRLPPLRAEAFNFDSLFREEKSLRAVYNVPAL
jgi:hypothetical protein